MSDTNLLFKAIAITATENTGSWVEIAPGAEVGKMIVRATGCFRLASSAAPGNNFLTVPSGVAFEHEAKASVYVQMPKAGIVQIARYS